MFDENFTFDCPRSPSLDSNTATTRDSSRSVSPCTAAKPYPQPRFSVTDLACQFADQRIQRQSPICYDSCEAYANTDNDAGWAIPPIEDEMDLVRPLSRARTFPRAQSPSRRVQRQYNTRLLCTSSHHRDIAALVAQMVETREQCSITPPGPLTPTRLDDEDEGYDSSDEPMVPTSRRSSVATVKSHRRSSDLKTTGACVSKNIRLRREKEPRRMRSSGKP